MPILDFARSTMTFRIDLDVIPPRTLSHQPPYAMNNARILIDSVCRITDRETGRVDTIVLGVSCKTERVAASADLWLDPNADFIPIFSNDTFMHIKTFARAGLGRTAHPPGTGTQPERLLAPIADTFVSVHLDLLEHEGERLAGADDIVQAVLANDAIVGVHRIESDRYVAEIEYPAKTINANERDVVYQTDTGPIVFPNLDVAPDELLAATELAFTAANQPDWAEFIVRDRTPVGDGIDVFHYSRPVRLDGIENAFYRIPADSAGARRRVTLPQPEGWS